jgi:chloramphenicol O-acetyltransferase
VIKDNQALENVRTVVNAMAALTWPPRNCAHNWTRLILAVSNGQKYVLDSRQALYNVLKAEPDVCQALLPFIEITAKQGETLSSTHRDAERVTLLKRAWRMIY